MCGQDATFSSSSKFLYVELGFFCFFYGAGV
jgi:hypothetical protein